MISVRPAGPADAGIVARHARALAHLTEGQPGRMMTADVRALLADPAYTLLVAGRDGAAEGYALAWPGFDTAYAARGLYLADLYVAEGARRLGIARALVCELCARAAAEGGEFVWWLHGPANAAACAAYDRLGAHRTDAAVRALYGAVFEARAAEGRGRDGA